MEDTGITCHRCGSPGPPVTGWARILSEGELRMTCPGCQGPAERHAAALAARQAPGIPSLARLPHLTARLTARLTGHG
jgi:hypothetical protein